MKLFRSINKAGVGAKIASVTGSTTDYDIVTECGHTLTGYDETAGAYDTTAPVAGDLLIFGIDGGSRRFAVANAEVLKEAVAELFMRPVVNPA